MFNPGLAKIFNEAEESYRAHAAQQEAEKAEAARIVALENEELWRGVLAPVYSLLPEALHQYVRYDSWSRPRHDELERGTVYLEAVPDVPIVVKIGYGGVILFCPQAAILIEETDDGHFYVRYGDCYENGEYAYYTDRLIAIGHALRLADGNYALEAAAADKNEGRG